jgi:pimeloyl-ACP methyl ester carboxylesterase
MSVRGAILKLESGGHIAYDEYGDPNGTPVIFSHGWPSSRSMAQLADAAGRELKVRIISPDRPGICGSALQEGRTLRDWPVVVRALAQHLELDQFRLLGISGGAPYVLVTAWEMPERVRAVAIVSGAPPIAELTDHAGLWRLHRWMLALHARQPELMRRLFCVARPFATTRMSLRARPLLRLILQRMDADALRDATAFEACFESSRQAWRASLDGVIADAEIYAKPWGFGLEEVRVPVTLWHGTRDRTFSYRLAEHVAQRIPGSALHIVEGAGHYSLPIRYMRDILADLLALPAQDPPG